MRRRRSPRLGQPRAGWLPTSTWSPSSRERNKRAHALHGNGAPGKGKGGRAKQGKGRSGKKHDGEGGTCCEQFTDDDDPVELCYRLLSVEEQLDSMEDEWRICYDWRGEFGKKVQDLQEGLVAMQTVLTQAEYRLAMCEEQLHHIPLLLQTMAHLGEQLNVVREEHTAPLANNAETIASELARLARLEERLTHVEQRSQEAVCQLEMLMREVRQGARSPGHAEAKRTGQQQTSQSTGSQGGAGARMRWVRKGGGTLFVGNLHFCAAQSEVRDALAEFGQVVSVHLVQCRTTGRSCGCAFVEFARLEDCVKAYQSTGPVLRGRTLRFEKPRAGMTGRGGQEVEA